MSLALRARAARARLALAAAGFAYNPLQPRGPDGRWIKAGTGVSASPAPAKKATRRAAAKKTTPDKARAAGWLADAKTRVRADKLSPEADRQVRELFAFEDPETGMRAEAYDTEAHGESGVLAHISIKNADGREVGRATRHFHANKETGEPQVYHTSFNLGRAVRGGGFSSRWLRQMEDRYRDAGIKSIGLTTNDVGGYAWAKAGFDFESDSSAGVLAAQFEGGLRQQDLSPEVRARADDLLRRARAGGDERPLPVEFAMLGWEPGAATWPGKQAMIGSSWGGVKEL